MDGWEFLISLKTAADVFKSASLRGISLFATVMPPSAKIGNLLERNPGRRRSTQKKAGSAFGVSRKMVTNELHLAKGCLVI
jgi:hypothetical protein